MARTCKTIEKHKASCRNAGGYFYGAATTTKGYDIASNPSGATWAVSAGSLHSGLSLSSSGVISGTPTRAETAAFTVRAAYGSSSTTQNLSITIYSSSNDNNTDTEESSGGGGCDSGLGVIGLAVLGITFTLKRKN